MSSKIQLSKEELRENKLTRDEYLSKPKIPLIVVLDNVTNSYNIGAFIRLADAFAIEKVIICRNSDFFVETMIFKLKNDFVR